MNCIIIVCQVLILVITSIMNETSPNVQVARECTHLNLRPLGHSSLMLMFFITFTTNKVTPKFTGWFTM